MVGNAEIYNREGFEKKILRMHFSGEREVMDWAEIHSALVMSLL